LLDQEVKKFLFGKCHNKVSLELHRSHDVNNRPFAFLCWRWDKTTKWDPWSTLQIVIDNENI